MATLVENIVRGSYKPIPGNYSSSIAELVRVMLRPEPSKRPTVAMVGYFFMGPEHNNLSEPKETLGSHGRLFFHWSIYN